MRSLVTVIAIFMVLQSGAQDFKYGKVSREELQEKEHEKIVLSKI